MAIDYISIGARIKYHRTRKGLSRADLSELTNISIPHISSIERGDKSPSLEFLINIANALEISADELLVDNLIASSNNHDGDDYYILLDCTPEEATILIKNMSGLKEILRKYTIK